MRKFEIKMNPSRRSVSFIVFKTMKEETKEKITNLIREEAKNVDGLSIDDTLPEKTGFTIHGAGFLDHETIHTWVENNIERILAF